MFNIHQVLRDNDRVFTYYARRFQWIESEEDLYQDLILYVIESYHAYTGNMTNYNSLTTLFVRRRINALIRRQKTLPTSFIEDAPAPEHENKIDLFVHVLDNVDFKVDLISNMDVTLGEIAWKLMEGYTKSEIAKEMKVNRVTFWSLLKDIKQKLEVYNNEMQSV